MLSCERVSYVDRNKLGNYRRYSVVGRHYPVVTSHALLR